MKRSNAQFRDPKGYGVEPQPAARGEVASKRMKRSNTWGGKGGTHDMRSLRVHNRHSLRRSRSHSSQSSLGEEAPSGAGSPQTSFEMEAKATRSGGRAPFTTVVVPLLRAVSYTHLTLPTICSV